MKKWVSRVNYILLSIVFMCVLFNFLVPHKYFSLLTIFWSIMYFLEDDLKECE